MGGPPQHLLWAALLTIIVIVQPAAIKDAPRRTIQREAEQKRVNTEDDIKLNCPIEGTPEPYYEWTKDLEPLNEEGWERVRLVRGTLRIKQVQPQDQGTYICTAVNGFGKEKYTFRLMVIDRLGTSLSPSKSDGLAPEFTQLMPVPGSQLSKPAGHSLGFKCKASGDPEPIVTWYKDGLELLEGTLLDENRLSRHQLHLSNLSPRDTGTYTCAAVNHFGAATTNWTLNVIDLATPREPEFSPLEPSNTTVVIGETATMQCSGSSEVKPHIKWLRRIGEAPTSNGDVSMSQGLNNKSSVITFKGYKYVVLSATKVVTPGDGTFFTKLEVPDAQSDAEGVYVCTATNNFGFSYRQASLTVLPAKQEPSIMMVVIGLVGVGGLVLLVGIICAVRRHQSKPPPPIGPSESALLPPVPPSQTKMHPPPSLQQPRYMAQRTPSGPPSAHSVPHGRMVGPEGALLQYSGGVVHLPPSAATMAANGQPIIVYQDPAQSVYISTPQRPQTQGPPSGTPSARHTEYQYQDSGRPSTQGSTTGRQDYQYQHLDVI
ncbi:unnamed protein product [Meganyctiphanes norvegica]|uniref:receptor protein-tyrosine kinase n=1 Tax=Meganyctiphanes norvegica TaxID=48144 RepID=A0AAV2RJ80_MEGNR